MICDYFATTIILKINGIKNNLLFCKKKYILKYISTLINPKYLICAVLISKIVILN